MQCRGGAGLFRAERAPLLDEAIEGHPGVTEDGGGWIGRKRGHERISSLLDRSGTPVP